MPNVDMSSIRQELHALLDRIPENGVPAAREYLRSLVDPLELALLTAPDDDEPRSEHERGALDEAERRKQRGERAISHEEILREFSPGETGQ